MTETGSRGLTTDSTLVERLRDWGDDQSWDQFCRIYRGLIYSFARKQGLEEHEANDVVQDTLLAVARSLHSFRRKGGGASFRSWLCCLTRHRSIDLVRRRRPQEVHLSQRNDADTQRTGTVDRIPDPQSLEFGSQWQAEWEGRILQAALEKLKRQISARDYQIFDLLVLQQEPPVRVARAVGISVGQVYLVKHRVMHAFKRMAKRIEGGAFD